MFICCMASLLSFFVKVVKLTFNIAHQHFLLLFVVYFCFNGIIIKSIGKIFVQPVIELRVSMLRDVFSRLTKRESY